MNQINTICHTEGGKSDAHTELNIQYNPKPEGMCWWCELIKSIQSPITALKPRSGNDVCRWGGFTPCLCSWRFLVYADIISFFLISLWRSLSQSGGRTAGYRKSPSAEPRAHTNPLTSQGNQLRTPTVWSRPAFDFWVCDLAKGQEKFWVEFRVEMQYN